MRRNGLHSNSGVKEHRCPSPSSSGLPHPCVPSPSLPRVAAPVYPRTAPPAPPSASRAFPANRARDAPNVPTAPISIPSTNAWQGNPIDEVRRRVERLVQTECGNGEMCVTVTVAMGDDDSYDQCQFASTVPDTSDPITLKPGSTLTLLTGTWPCETSSSTEPEPTESEPQPTESTPAPTATQTVTNVRPSG
jgi:hypothetical protein